jgi:hypothetical protein
MKTRVFLTVLLATMFTFSLAVAGEKGEKTAKKTSAKKTMSCCETKEAKACTDAEKKNCDMDDVKTPTKSEVKSEVKKENKDNK